jgi:type II secretory pathway pseudopilin PulG
MRQQAGFTIIEVSLFLAVSGLLLATLVFGTQRMIGQTRFSDSVNDLTAYIQSQYESVRSGVNLRSNDPTASLCDTSSGVGVNKCFLLGKVMQFVGGVVRTYYVVGEEVADSGTTDIKAMIDSHPQVDEASRSDYTVQWGAFFKNEGNNNAGYRYSSVSDDLAVSDIVDSIAILRSPVSARIMVYQFKGSANTTTLRSAISAGYPDTNLNYNSSAVYRVQSEETFGPSDAAICVEEGATAASVHSVAPYGIAPLTGPNAAARCKT